MKKDKSIIEKIFTTLELGTIKEIKYIESSQNTVHKVTTDNKDYYIKQYSKDAIKNDKDLLNRKRQVAICEKLSENGVPAIVPLKFNDRFFIKYNKNYYLLYEYYPYEPIESQDLTLKHIRKLANTLAIIHKLNVKSSLKCQYKKINIDFNKYLKKYQKLDNSLYELLTSKQEVLEELINNCNSNIKKVKENLCVSHNDYKLKNIIWNKDYMYLIDFDASAMSNPTVSFAEAAFALSLQDKKFNKEFYKDFISSYIKKFGELEDNFNDCLEVCMNGKLQWLEYLMSKCSKLNKQAILDTKSMINELSVFIDNKEEMLTIYNEFTTTRKPKKKKKQKKKKTKIESK